MKLKIKYVGLLICEKKDKFYTLKCALILRHEMPLRKCDRCQQSQGPKIYEHFRTALVSFQSKKRFSCVYF